MAGTINSKALVLPQDLPLDAFRATVWSWYRSNKRSFLWRENTSPYMVFLSEIMLQQTQTSRVAALLPAFLAKFPNIVALAEAGPGQVIAAWQGFGYNRRAKNLHTAAGIIRDSYAGIVPADMDALQSLPGIGPNTAASIMVYAWNFPEPFVETNIRTVFIHHFYGDQANRIPLGEKGARDQDIRALVAASIDSNNPREWFWALMDYGVELKRTVGNLSRKSRAYTPQSTFAGSLREARGAIVRSLATLGPGTEGELREACGEIETERYTRALEDLVREGLVVAEKDFYRLP